MNLWIRSQDKQQLITEIKNIYIESDDGLGYEIYCFTPYYAGAKLGTYKSFVRAKEVMDEIQKIISCDLRYIIDGIDKQSSEEDINKALYLVGGIDMKAIQLSSIVYEMPEE